MTCNTSGASAHEILRAQRREKRFGSTDRSVGNAQLREAKRQAKAIAALLGAAA